MQYITYCMMHNLFALQAVIVTEGKVLLEELAVAFSPADATFYNQ